MAELEVTESQLATAINVPSGTVRGWKRGSHLPAGKNLLKLAAALRLNPSQLILGGSK